MNLLRDNGSCRLCGFLDSQEGHAKHCEGLNNPGINNSLEESGNATINIPQMAIPPMISAKAALEIIAKDGAPGSWERRKAREALKEKKP